MQCRLTGEASMYIPENALTTDQKLGSNTYFVKIVIFFFAALIIST